MANNYLHANYGGAQGFDNDDGSSWYDHHDNFVRGGGFKMDYGGHSSIFHSNFVIVDNGWGNVFNVAGMFQGHEDFFYDNDAIMPNSEKVADLFDNCNESPPYTSTKGTNNRYYTPKGNATVTCDCCGLITLAELSKISPLTEKNFTTNTLPTNDFILALAKNKLKLPAA